ncbi:hypothetical protein SAMN05660485_01418 [Blastococcus fimeti]|nr:hypothetical protein SAMN05660485_01418 [Blastococcus fimeti]
MKHALAAYGVVLVVLLMLARQYEAAGWTGVGALDVATALVNSLLVVAVAAGLLLAGRLSLAAWARSMDRWRRAQAAADGSAVPDARIVGVTSWRAGSRPSPEPPALPGAGPLPAQTVSAGFTYVGPTYAREAPAAPPFPERRGRRI